jgi:geranylgeranyl diphosphate synthase, type II
MTSGASIAPVLSPGRSRPPAKTIPQTKAERDRLLLLARQHVARERLVPPMPLEELQGQADRLLAVAGLAPVYRSYATVLINNELWREALAAVPFSRRLLLLPKCLRSVEHCSAPFDEFGLVCQRCGWCSIYDLQGEAERLGYTVLVAEGSALVMSLIQTGHIDAIVGVSCPSVLEKAFPHMESAAIPGIAIPLHQDDCANTSVDVDWVLDCLHLTCDDQTRRLDLSGLRAEVETWFTRESLDEIMGPAPGGTENAGRDWLARAGKRWRPFLAVAAFQALRPDEAKSLPEDLKKIAVSVECFHKASLIHDDIEDDDDLRYGEKTLHAEHGVPFALNVGDLLIGEGYRLIGECQASPEQKVKMLAVAAAGQRKLCVGQGAELGWMRARKPLSTAEVIEIFRHKTAPAFEVSLLLGAVYAGGHAAVEKVIGQFSEALGIAYQIRDDVEDFGNGGADCDFQARRPNLLLALAGERAQGIQKEQVAALWQRGETSLAADTTPIYRALAVESAAARLMERYKSEAIDSLRALSQPSLKGLLRRVVGKIFNSAELLGWCGEISWHKSTPPQ